MAIRGVSYYPEPSFVQRQVELVAEAIRIYNLEVLPLPPGGDPTVEGQPGANHQIVAWHPHLSGMGEQQILIADVVPVHAGVEPLIRCWRENSQGGTWSEPIDFYLFIAYLAQKT